MLRFPIRSTIVRALESGIVEMTLHAGNIAAAFAVVATAMDLTLIGGLGSAFGAALSGHAI
jgi:hypothetical protein